MAEDFDAIIAEAAAAIEQNGFICTIWGKTGGAVTPWDLAPDLGDMREIWVISSTRQIRDKAGFLIGQTVRTLTTAATGQAISKGERIAIGKTIDQAALEDPTQWAEITSLRVTEPSGIPVLYKIDLIQ